MEDGQKLGLKKLRCCLASVAIGGILFSIRTLNVEAHEEESVESTQEEWVGPIDELTEIRKIEEISEEISEGIHKEAVESESTDTKLLEASQLIEDKEKTEIVEEENDETISIDEIVDLEVTVSIELNTEIVDTDEMASDFKEEDAETNMNEVLVASDETLTIPIEETEEEIKQDANKITEVVNGERIAGRSRDQLAVEVCKKSFEKSETVFITNGFKKNDALVGSSLAGIYNAPILFTRDNILPQETLDELKRLEAKRVIILGGNISVPEKILAEIRKVVPNVERIDGRNRYVLANNIAEQVRQIKGATSHAFLVNGEAYADAASVAPIAAGRGIPIYLTRPNTLHEEVAAIVNQMDYWYLVGGNISIPEKVSNELIRLGGVVEHRFSGLNRYEVNRSINKYFNTNRDAVYIASGENDKLADALAIAPVAGREQRGLVLIKNKDRHVVPLQRKFIEDYGFEKLVFVGGTKTISEDTRLEMMGYNRFETLDRILNSKPGKYITSSTQVSNPILTKDMVTDRISIGVADPFIVEDNGRYHIFFEVLTNGDAEIGHAYSDDLMKWTYTRIVLDNSRHRSAYPNVFKVDDTWYMIPDSAGRGNVHLYKATDFPFKWEHVSILIETPKTIVDTNVFEYQENWYLTTTGGEDGWNKGVSLYINQSDDWRNNQWTKHPANIIIPTDHQYNGVRGAGNPMVFDDVVLMPIQVTPRSTGIYGEKTLLYKMTNLTKTTVDVTNLGLLVEGQKNHDWNSKSMHHVSHTYTTTMKDFIYVVDGQCDDSEYRIGLYQYI